MRTILTLKYGNKFTSESVNSIYEKTNGKYHYVCLTDDPTGLDPAIETRRINPEYGHWNKVLMLQHTDLGHVLYFDLDTNIQKDIDILWKTSYNNNTIVYTHWKDKNFPTERVYNQDIKLNYLGNYNSSILSWTKNSAINIVDKFLKNEDYYMVKYAGGDDRFFWHECDFKHFPKHLIYSYVYGADLDDNQSFKYRPDYIVALLNGQEQFPGADVKYYDALSLHKVGKQV